MKRIIAIALLALLLTGCAKVPEPTGTAPSLIVPGLTPPEIVEVTVGTFSDYYALPATVVPYTQGLSFSISGKIGKVHVYPGKAVEAGELLAELEHSSLSGRIETLEADIANVKTVADYTDRMARLEIDILHVELSQLEDQLATAEGADIPHLKQQIALKKNDIAQAQADLRQEQAMREAKLAPKQAELAQLREELKLHFLYAPYSGRIAYDIALPVGYPVAQSAPVIALSDESRMVLDILGGLFDYDEANVHSIYVRIGSTDYQFRQIPPTEQELLYAAQNDTSPNTYFEILGSEEDLAKLEFGQYGNVCFTNIYQENALMIPLKALIEGVQFGQYYVDVDENGQRVRRSVEIGGSNGLYAWVTEGLEEGAYVYVE